MLSDSAHLMARDVEHVNRHRKGRPREPLYEPDDVASTLERLVRHDYHAPWELFEGVRVEYFNAGHILGAALTTFEFSDNGRTLRLGMGGDLGRPDRPILVDPEHHPGVDVLVLESAYGNRFHSPAGEAERELVEVVERTAARGGRLLIPAFAVGRTQELVATFHTLCERGEVPDLPIFVDSPMAREATGVFVRHPECFDEETARVLKKNGTWYVPTLYVIEPILAQGNPLKISEESLEKARVVKDQMRRAFQKRGNEQVVMRYWEKFRQGAAAHQLKDVVAFSALILVLVFASLAAAMTPLLVAGLPGGPHDVGERDTFGDLGATAAEILGVPWNLEGRSFAAEVTRSSPSENDPASRTVVMT